MATVATIMTEAVEIAQVGDSLATAARRMQEMDVGALPVLGADNRLVGIITDRDIVVKGVAAGLDPKECTVRVLIDAAPVCVGSQEEIEQAAAKMAEHRIRRLPVVDGGRLVGHGGAGGLGVRARASARRTGGARHLAGEAVRRVGVRSACHAGNPDGVSRVPPRIGDR